MQPIKIVAKFGGTSVRNAEAIKQVSRIVETNAAIRVVVVSAVSGITNRLVELYESPPEARAEILNEIKNVHLDIAHGLGLTDTLRAKVDSEVARLAAFRAGILSKENLDEILSAGERLSSIFVCEFLKSKDIKATWLDAAQILKTDAHFGKATPQLQETKQRCAAVMKDAESDEIFVTQGFIGSAKDGRITTLGRGGSDYSAALFAEAFSADELHIYTDVTGVYTMDPNVVQAAVPIPQISFSEMAEMANFGAKVLHPDTLTPCQRSKIPVKILSTFEPTHPGTHIFFSEDHETSMKPRVRAITMRKKQILVTIKSLKMLDAHGFLARIFGVLAEHRISVDLISTSEISVALTIDGTNLGSHGLNPFSGEELLSELQAFSEVVIEEGLTLVALVGSALRSSGVVQSILAELTAHPIRMICYGASASSIGLLVPAKDATTVANKLHRTHIEVSADV